MQSRHLVVVAVISIVILGGIALGLYGRSSLDKEPVDTPDCEGWNTEAYFKSATANDVADCLRAGADVHAVTTDGITPLLWAAHKGKDPNVIAVLVHAGADANERREIEGATVTPLIVAARRRDGTAAMAVLLDKGGNPNLRGHEGVSALHVAAEYGVLESVALLLDRGGDVFATDDRGRTPLQAASTQFSRGWDHHGRISNVISVIRVLLENGGDASDLAGQGWTDMHTAALLGSDPDEILALIDQGLDPSAETSSGWTTLHMAAFANENPSIITALIDGGVNPDVWVGDKSTDRLRHRLSNPQGVCQGVCSKVRIGDGRTPLHCAAFGNPNPSVIAALLRGGANPNAKTTTGWTPLHAAVYANPNPDVIAALLKGGADANARINESWTFGDSFPYSPSVLDSDRQTDYLYALDGQALGGLRGLSTALHVAAEFPRDPSVIATLIRGGADSNGRDVAGETPLHSVENSTDAVTLMEAGADPNARGEYGNTPLHNAVLRAEFSGDLELVSTLIDRGAEVNAGRESGWTPLHSASLGSKPNPKLISLLIRHGADANARSEDGNTPFHIVASSKTTEPAVFDELVQSGADPNSRNVRGETPLFKASNQGTVAWLIDAGADPNLRDEKGRTPLHAALARFSSATVIDALLDGGANAALSDVRGVTPWDLAQEQESLKGTKTYWRLNDARFE